MNNHDERASSILLSAAAEKIEADRVLRRVGNDLRRAAEAVLSTYCEEEYGGEVSTLWQAIRKWNEVGGYQ